MHMLFDAAHQSKRALNDAVELINEGQRIEKVPCMDFFLSILFDVKNKSRLFLIQVVRYFNSDYAMK